MRRASRSRPRWLWLAAVIALCAANLSHAYAPEAHQELTFLAAKQLSRCLGDGGPAQLSPLEVRAIANSNAATADSNFFTRLVRWNYYDPLERDDNAVAWLVDTRFTDHFRKLVRELERARSEERALEALGGIISYVQTVTSPARGLPVYAPRFWRWTLSDRFDHYPLREAEIEARLDEDCSHLAQPPESYQAVLAEAAADTSRAVQGAVGRLPATWESFWTPPEAAGDFGSYGPAGNNFGRYTEFPCGKTDNHICVLITDDPAYTAFALERQLAAVRATARAMLLFLQARGDASLQETGREGGDEEEPPNAE